jgi:hypothetical protein
MNGKTLGGNVHNFAVGLIYGCSRAEGKSERKFLRGKFLLLGNDDGGGGLK